MFDAFLPCQLLVEVQSQVFYFSLNRYLHIIDGNPRAGYTFRGDCKLH
jgi:hypothetical protein